ncbi:hypothetical protein C486_01954 [Natrinema gari JCM 14663]|uniref:Uncharacterized protein n=1 Tax=Natrinema gari JCM 14663 TaxID=1230459 RepID=L9ZED1_9EURY|nr:hypothetical protein C486_01954 [Natrinema gari JCM 14663]
MTLISRPVSARSLSLWKSFSRQSGDAPRRDDQRSRDALDVLSRRLLERTDSRCEPPIRLVIEATAARR